MDARVKLMPHKHSMALIIHDVFKFVQVNDHDYKFL